ncbi:hypothetical protein GBA63_07105 [Rubrobacter tropicus]|uniref:Uncharacterized protein n=1 Tax=Rubrobacter tropicus TaxID=2653851 RepID=A0A6G8Q7I5_9ACTN|nr:hypothetical protein [Rubrobacter tropicus]QIN82441.1 hypothetical protein GBA63_07105 [Rubrobacter tropicus]
MARRILPTVVVLWASLAMIGGAVHLVNESEAATQDTAAKAGLGLCAVSFAFLARKAARQALPSVPTGALMPEPAPVIRASVPYAHFAPPVAGPPLLVLLRVSRT